MAKDYSAHTRLMYANYADIAAAITDGKINANDIVFCKDTYEMVLVRSDLTFYPIKSKTYVFNSEDEAVTALNAATDTYAGQIVSILGSNGAYGTYVVNENDGQFEVVSVALSAMSFDYNQAYHKPIQNVVGDANAVPVIADLGNGVYRITGSYKVIASSDTTVVTSGSAHLVAIDTIGGIQYIRVITAARIYDYSIAADGTVTDTFVVTRQWLVDQGYATQSYVDKVIDDAVESHIADTLTNAFVEATDDELKAMFA